MADKKLNDLAQLPSLGSLKNIYVEDANGVQYKLTKESLAEVLGGLIGINDTWIKAKPLATSWDETTPGLYTTTDSTTKGLRPGGIFNYGLLAVLRSSYAASAQLYISHRGEMAIRCSILEYGVEYTEWKIIKTT